MKLATLLPSAVLLVIAAPAAFPQEDLPAAAEAEELVRVDVTGLQSVYAHPDADLSRYDKIMLDPIEVAFSESWERQHRGYRGITSQEKGEIQRNLERVLKEEFTNELAKKGRYEVVEAPEPDVLRIKAEIRDLYVNAPDLRRPGITRSYTRSTGEMTLVAELRDASTGALLARIIDRAKDPESAWLELTTQIDNTAAARRAAVQWARILRGQLDAARVVREDPSPEL